VAEHCADGLFPSYVIYGGYIQGLYILWAICVSSRQVDQCGAGPMGVMGPKSLYRNINGQAYCTHISLTSTCQFSTGEIGRRETIPSSRRT